MDYGCGYELDKRNVPGCDGCACGNGLAARILGQFLGVLVSEYQSDGWDGDLLNA